MILLNMGFKGVLDLKLYIQKLPNDALISEWINIRQFNDYCTPSNQEQCIKCSRQRNCARSLLVEEVFTEEIVKRGLLHYAKVNFIQYQKNKPNETKSNFLQQLKQDLFFEEN